MRACAPAARNGSYASGTDVDAAGQLAAEHCVDVGLARRRHLDADLVHWDFELLGDKHRQRREDALPHSERAQMIETVLSLPTLTQALGIAPGADTLGGSAVLALVAASSRSRR
jgi:hypothetical protein